MPRYYFHAQRGQVIVLDHEGLELAGMAEATEEAARRALSFSGRVLIGDASWWPPLSEGAIGQSADEAT